MEYNVESSEQIGKVVAMHEYLVPMLECPVCQGELDWTIEKRNKDRMGILGRMRSSPEEK